MTDGFLKVAAVTPKIKVADTVYNAGEITNLILEADHAGAKVIVLPELCITGYTCSDLFLQDTLLNEAKEALFRIAKDTEDTDALVFVGLPIEKEQKLYNAAAVLKSGEILAFIPKENIPSYGEFYEARHFTPGNHASDVLHAAHMDIPFGTDILFACENMEGLVVGCEICEDVWAAETPGTRHVLAGADVIVNLSASNDLVGKDTYRKELVKATSARLLSAYVYASAGDGESTQDTVYSGHNIIAENGTVLSESVPFTTGILYADLDIQKLRMERRRMTTFVSKNKHSYLSISFSILQNGSYSFSL